jgi:hypothetical protein
LQYRQQRADYRDRPSPDPASRWDAYTAALTTSTAPLPGEAEDLDPDRAARADSSGENISTGVKHVDRRVLGVKQQIAAGIYVLDWVPSADNPSDIGATYKSKTEFERLRTMIMGYAFPRSSCSYLRDTEEPSHWSKNAQANPAPADQAGQSE